MEDAASPLVVIATFVLVAAGLTALLVFLIVDSGPALELRQEGRGAEARFVVAESSGLSWGELEVRLVDRSGADQAALLDVPEGRVDGGDAIAFARPPPGGTYVLQVLLDGTELERLNVQV